MCTVITISVVRIVVKYWVGPPAPHVSHYVKFLIKLSLSFALLLALGASGSACGALELWTVEYDVSRYPLIPTSGNRSGGIRRARAGSTLDRARAPAVPIYYITLQEPASGVYCKGEVGFLAKKFCKMS